MSANSYYTQTFEVWDKGVTLVQGVNKEVPVLLDTFLGVLDKAPTQYAFSSDQENYNITNALYTAINSNIVEDTIIKFGSVSFDVHSVIDPMGRGHHLEVLLERRKSGS